MGDKKDPGKFTIRFNIEDPQQLAVVDWLNRQGRYKAQFITSAVLYYTHAAAVPAPNGSAIPGITADTQSVGQDIEPGRGFDSSDKAADPSGDGNVSGLDDVGMDAILKTMSAFRSA